MTELIKKMQIQLEKNQHQQKLIESLDQYQIIISPYILEQLNQIKKMSIEEKDSNKELIDLLNQHEFLAQEISRINQLLKDFLNKVEKIKEKFTKIQGFFDNMKKLTDNMKEVYVSTHFVVGLKEREFSDNYPKVSNDSFIQNTVFYIERKSILEIIEHLKPYMVKISDSPACEKNNITELLNTFLTGIYRLTQTISFNIILTEKPEFIWIFDKIAEEMKRLLKPFLSLIDLDFLLPDLNKGITLFLKKDYKTEYNYDKPIKIENFFGKKEWVSIILDVDLYLKKNCDRILESLNFLL